MGTCPLGLHLALVPTSFTLVPSGHSMRSSLFSSLLQGQTKTFETVSTRDLFPLLSGMVTASNKLAEGSLVMAWPGDGARL